MRYLQKLFLLSFVIVFSSCQCNEQDHNKVISEPPKEVKENILVQMEASRHCWNKGDFEGYMQVYWKSDSMLFMGINKVTNGWEQTLKNYKKGYPDAAAIGELKYTFEHFNMLADDCVLLIGKYHLTREIGDADGYFSLVWKNIDGEWKIILDHT
ncbi:YybH family protein [Carboxylicivirga sp. N1Y90]|uniref:YybH family protein n=1 Tax=Carboxylicivirga fragile TaxID=3417571 RepID=UPI003D33EF61|nr:nuclear transport factor 2 family protein [Marinilabiliaceae bacterium N1Y90]